MSLQDGISHLLRVQGARKCSANLKVWPPTKVIHWTWHTVLPRGAIQGHCLRNAPRWKSSVASTLDSQCGALKLLDSTAIKVVYFEEKSIFVIIFIIIILGNTYACTHIYVYVFVYMCVYIHTHK